MKALLAAILSMFALSSCVFEFPFATEAGAPVNEKLLGLWESVPRNENEAVHHMLVLQYSDREYVVGYPLGENAMAFRAIPVILEGAEYIQIQLIGTASGPVDRGDRKYHLLELKPDGDHLQVRTINPELLGKNLRSTADMLAAFREKRDDPGLFAEPIDFRRVK